MATESNPPSLTTGSWADCEDNATPSESGESGFETLGAHPRTAGPDGLHDQKRSEPASPRSEIAPTPPRSTALTPSTEAMQNSPDERLISRVARLISAQESLSKMRLDVTRMRLQTQERRNHLSQQREIAGNWDAKLQKALNLFFATDMTGDITNILTLYEEQRQVRDLIGPLESAYNKRENDLGEKELELKDRELRFDRRLRRLLPKDNSMETLSATESSATSNAGSNLSRRVSIDEHPAATAYFSRAQDVNLVQERLAELRYAQEGYLEEERRLGHVSVPLFQEGREFLDNYDQLVAETERKLGEVKADAERLRQIAIDEGALAEDSRFDTFEEESLLLTAQEPSGTRSSILVPILEDNDIAARYIVQFRDSRDRVNRWLLHMLRTSRLQVFEYKAKNRYTASLDDREWTSLALQKWPVDAAAAQRPNSQPPATPNRPASHPTTPSLASAAFELQPEAEPHFMWSRTKSC